MAKELTIKLGSKDKPLTVETLTEALENTLRMLRSLERQFMNADEPISWEIVRAGMRSPLSITLVPHPPRELARQRIGEKVVKAAVNGLKLLEREPQLPPHFDEETLEAAKDLAAVTVGARAATKNLWSGG